jgi:hypothetical protein
VVRLAREARFHSSRLPCYILIVPATDSSANERLLVMLLRLGGGVTMTAFLAMLLPTDWMAAAHEWLGLGAFPRAPVVDYLARSVAGLYGFHGVLLLLLARDPVQHRAIVRYIGAMNLIFGGAMVLIDIHAGLPLLWTLAEGPPIVAFGVVVLYLSRSL